jgi:DNA-binding XRE family transcriptional regulator
MNNAYTTLQEVLPNPALFRQMIPCPRCGAEYCIDGVRRGPAIIGISQNTYKPICLACWHKGKKGRTEQAALHNWNEEKAVLDIRKLRERAGLSVEELSELAGISDSMIWQYERRQSTPSPPTKRKLAKALGVKTSKI